MKQRKNFKYNGEFVEALASIVENELKPSFGISELTIYTEHKRQGQIFRSSPYFLGKPWRDWVMVNWDGGLTLPAQIWGFIDLTTIPSVEGEREPGVYAIVESCTPVKTPSEANLSRLFVPYKKDIEEKDGKVTRKFWLVDTEAFHSSTTVIPDIGNIDDTAFLRLKSKDEWAEGFSDWLRTQPKRRNFTKIF